METVSLRLDRMARVEARRTVGPLGDEMLSQIQNHKRLIPIPRQLIRLLAKKSRPALFAVVLGTLIRCLYIRKNEVSQTGTCKSSWLARLFGLHARNIKAARKMLVREGWIVIHQTAQWRMNRFGGTVAINLAWKESGGQTRKSPPPKWSSTTRSSLPDSNKKLHLEYKNQKPAFCGPPGVRKASTNTKKEPTLRNVCAEDLSDRTRMQMLYEQAVGRGLVGESESERLALFAAAEHAKAVATRNAPGLFIWLIRGKHWDFVTQRDEDAARRLVKRSVFPEHGADGNNRGGDALGCVQAVLSAWDARKMAGRVAKPQPAGVDTKLSWRGRVRQLREHPQVRHAPGHLEVERRSIRTAFQVCSL